MKTEWPVKGPRGGTKGGYMQGIDAATGSLPATRDEA